MAEATKSGTKMTKPGDGHSETETSELLARVQEMKPRFRSNADAAQAAAVELEQLAARHGMNVERFLREAHTTRNAQEHHILAMALERRVALLRR